MSGGKFRYMILQIDKGRPRSDPLRLGVLNPINADGFYSGVQEAEGVAAYMAEERPELETYIVSTIRKIGA